MADSFNIARNFLSVEINPFDRLAGWASSPILLPGPDKEEEGYKCANMSFNLWKVLLGWSSCGSASLNHEFTHSLTHSLTYWLTHGHTVSLFQHILNSINFYQPITTSNNLYLPYSTFIIPFQPLPTSVNFGKPQSNFINLYQLLLTSIFLN